MRIAQITDIHMIGGPPAPGGYDPAAALDAVLAAVTALSPSSCTTSTRPTGS